MGYLNDQMLADLACFGLISLLRVL